jgi:2'-5' RNA ligase
VTTLPASERMTILAIVSYPSIEEADRRWIESVRAIHDPQAPRIDLHFTLVFPTDASPAEVAAEAAAVARSAGPILFTIRRARAVRDVVGGGGHVFLEPDEGRGEIATLHDRLYQGVLRPHLRADLPFTPHMTVAAGADLAECEGLVKELNLNHRTVPGILRSIELVTLEKPRVDSIATFVLGGSGGVYE